MLKPLERGLAEGLLAEFVVQPRHFQPESDRVVPQCPIIIETHILLRIICMQPAKVDRQHHSKTSQNLAFGAT